MILRVDERRQVTLVTVIGSAVGALLVAFFAPIDGLSKTIVVLCIIVAGQATRYIIIRKIGLRGMPKRITKREMETEVRGFFDEHPDIAARYLRMDELSKKARYNDALSIGNSLKKEPSLSPIVKRYLEYRIEQFKRNMRFGLK